ncbi:hypothetical protein FNF29_06394 [Cafeteria roenbergensis]|uniref:Guanylate cyclase domain-containing protein n=1 Tax=Cafeteria roenbergensis TaxID=33653 RepID=A0A5A8CAV4_CAFRO|nr:hypothetical protein FNF29_06394 [Cafeteria roenbergensis]|eukprot:KAA0148921.1 hypothetical protein FNF29_06394 [Cafeteria roenbergensis]
MSQVSPAAAASKDGVHFSPSHRTGSHKSSIELDAKSVVPGKGMRPAGNRSSGSPKEAERTDSTQATPAEQSGVRARWKQLLRTEGPKHMGRDNERDVAKELKAIEHEHRVTKAGDVIKLSSVALSAIRRLRAARGSVVTGEPDVTELAEEMRRRRLTQRELMELDPEQLLARGFGIDDLTDQLIVEHIVSSDCTATEVQTVFRSTLEKNRSQAFHLVVAETLIQKGEPLMAEEILYFATKRFKEDTQRRIRQLHGLALAQGGSTERAIVVLEQLQLEGAMDDEGGGLLARCYKDLAARERNAERRTALLNKAHAIYKEAFEAGGRSSYYTGINTATMAMLTGRTVEAIALADDVVAICRKELESELKAARAAAKLATETGSAGSVANAAGDCASEGGATAPQVASVSSAPHTDELVVALRPFFKPSHYWCLATIGEANVIIGDFEAAAEHYEAARECAGDSWVRIASTQRQLRLLLKHKVEAGLGPQALRALQKGEAGAFRAALARGGVSAEEDGEEDGEGAGTMSVFEAADEEAAGAARARLTAAVRSTMELHRASAKSEALRKRVLAVLYDTRRTIERQQQQRQPRARGGRRQARRASLPETFSESIMTASLAATGMAKAASGSFGAGSALRGPPALESTPSRSTPGTQIADSSSAFRPSAEAQEREDSRMRRRAQEAALMARDGPFACLMDIPTVAVFLACETDELYAVPSPGAEAALRKQLRQSLRACNARFAYCCPCTLADVLFLEVAAELGCEVYIVLPVPMDVHIAWCTTRFMDVERYDVIASAPPDAEEESADDDATAVAARAAGVRLQPRASSGALASAASGSGGARGSRSTLRHRATSGDSANGARSRRRKRGRRKSLLFSTSALIQRLRDQLAAAARVDIANDMSPEMTVTNRHYASLLVDGLARKRAQLLGTATRRLYCHGEVMPSRLTVRSWLQRRPHEAEFPGEDGITASGIHLMPRLTAPGGVKEFACNLTAKGLFPGAEAGLGAGLDDEDYEDDEDDDLHRRGRRPHDSEDDRDESGDAPATAERMSVGRRGMRSPAGNAFGSASAEGKGEERKRVSRRTRGRRHSFAGLTPMEDESLYVLRSEAQHTVAVAAAHARATAIAKAVAAGAEAAGMQLSPGLAMGAKRPGMVGASATPLAPVGQGNGAANGAASRQADRSPLMEGLRESDGSVMRGVSLAGNSMMASRSGGAGLGTDLAGDAGDGAAGRYGGGARDAGPGAKEASRSLTGPLSGFGAPRDSVGAESVPESAGRVQRFSTSGPPDGVSPSAAGKPPVAVPGAAGPGSSGWGSAAASGAGAGAGWGGGTRVATHRTPASGRGSDGSAAPTSPALREAMLPLATLFAAPLAVEHWIAHATPFRVVVLPFSIRAESHEHLMAMLPAATVRKAHSAQRLVRRDRSSSDATNTPTAVAVGGSAAKVSALRAAKASSFSEGVVVATAVGSARTASHSQNPEVSVAAVMANISEGGSGSETGSRRDEGFTEEELQLAAKAQDKAARGARWVGAVSAAARSGAAAKAAASGAGGDRPSSADSGAGVDAASGDSSGEARGRGVTFSEVVGRATVRSALDADLSRALELLVPAFQSHSGIHDARVTAAGGDASDRRQLGLGGTERLRMPLFGAPAPSIRRQVIAAPLFADVVNFSKLSEPQVLVFIENVLGAIANLIDSMPPRARPRIQQTWGDALYGVWSRVPDAGEFALMLSDLITKVPWHTLGLPSNLNIRISLHAAPVHVVTDPILRLKNYTGVHTSRAARIEPITPPGSVYCTQAFAAISEMLGVQSYECTYVGNVPLAKKYGMQPVFAVRWKSSSRTVPRRLHQRLRNTLRHLAGRARKDTADEAPPAKPARK